MSPLNQNYQAYFGQWMQEGLDEKQVNARLVTLNIDSEGLTNIATEYNKYRQNIRSKKGLNCILIGAILGFLSCMLTLLNVMPELRDFFLVGLTTLGISVAVYGCYCIFE